MQSKTEEAPAECMRLLAMLQGRGELRLTWEVPDADPAQLWDAQEVPLAPDHLVVALPPKTGRERQCVPRSVDILADERGGQAALAAAHHAEEDEGE